MVSAEPAFGTPYSGDSQAKAKVRSKSHLSRVCDPLPVTEEHIGLLFYFFVCPDKGRDLAEREQTRHIRKDCPADMMSGLDRLKAGPSERDNDGDKEVGLPGVGYICSRNDFYPGGKGLYPHLRCKRFLESYRFLGGEVPAVQPRIKR